MYSVSGGIYFGNAPPYFAEFTVPSGFTLSNLPSLGLSWKTHFDT